MQLVAVLLLPLLGAAIGMASRAEDIESLARVMHSEWASGTDFERTVIAWATLNEATAHGLNVTAYVTRPFDTYGSQEEGRPVSSARVPPASSSSWTIAAQILDGTIPDPTGGATRYFDPTTQDAMHERWLRGETAVRYLSSEEIIAKWTGEGLQAFTLPGTRGDQLVLFRRGDGTGFAPALSSVRKRSAIASASIFALTGAAVAGYWWLKIR